MYNEKPAPEGTDASTEIVANETSDSGYGPRNQVIPFSNRMLAQQGHAWVFAMIRGSFQPDFGVELQLFLPSARRTFSPWHPPKVANPWSVLVSSWTSRRRNWYFSAV